METIASPPSDGPSYADAPRLAGSNDEFHHTCDYHHLHFAVPFPQRGEVWKTWNLLCSFEEEHLFEDTFFSVGQTNGRELWLRFRKNLCSRASTLMLSETWQSAFKTCLRLKEYHGDSEIRERLCQLKFSPGPSPLEQQFVLRAKFRFFRSSGRSEKCGMVYFDETLFGITLNFKIDTAQQFEFVLREAQGLKRAKSKLVTEMTSTVYSEHICGHRRETLEGDSDGEGDIVTEKNQSIFEGPRQPESMDVFYSRELHDFGAKVRDRLRQKVPQMNKNK